MLTKEVLKELEKLDASNRTVDLVLAALAGEESVEGVLKGETPTFFPLRETGADERIPSVYLQDVTVSGFRGIGPEARLEIPPGPGLTVVIGRNGSGKSSFAEALEVLLTGNTLRWSDKRGPWQEGWKNLHYPSPPKITARFQVAAKRGLTTVESVWAEGSDLAGGKRTAQHHGERLTDLGGIGWELPLDLYRPLLSYNELGMIGRVPRLSSTLSPQSWVLICWLKPASRSPQLASNGKGLINRSNRNAVPCCLPSRRWRISEPKWLYQP